MAGDVRLGRMTHHIKPYSDSEGVSLETNTQTDASHLTMTPTGIESIIQRLDTPLTQLQIMFTVFVGQIFDLPEQMDEKGGNHVNSNEKR